MIRSLRIGPFYFELNKNNYDIQGFTDILALSVGVRS